jgi:hypothetical protein
MHCADVWDKNYTTIAQVLADSTTLSALIADSNAVDYMVRSTTWATDVCSNQSAMSYIGLNDYCADTLLGDSTWLNAICDSTYFESVLNVKVPTMTSNNTPSGVANAYRNGGNNYAPWKAFDGSSATTYGTGDRRTSNDWISYTFPSPMRLYKFDYLTGVQPSYSISVQGSNDEATWSDLYTGSINSDGSVLSEPISNNNPFTSFRIKSNETSPSTYWFDVQTIQFYGRSTS